jgi:hypothetical protein
LIKDKDTEDRASLEKEGIGERNRLLTTLMLKSTGKSSWDKKLFYFDHMVDHLSGRTTISVILVIPVVLF